MVNKLVVISALLILASCSKQTQKDREDAANLSSDKGRNMGSYDPKASYDSDNPKMQYAGTWACSAATCGVDTKVELQADGSFKLWIGNAIQEGTWDVMPNKRIFVKSATLKNGQEWEVKGHSDSTLDLCWNPDSGDPKTIPFARQ